jgi:hypothetical protein
MQSPGRRPAQVRPVAVSRLDPPEALGQEAGRFGTRPAAMRAALVRAREFASNTPAAPADPASMRVPHRVAQREVHGREPRFVPTTRLRAARIVAAYSCRSHPAPGRRGGPTTKPGHPCAQPGRARAWRLCAPPIEPAAKTVTPRGLLATRGFAVYCESLGTVVPEPSRRVPGIGSASPRSSHE